MFTCHMEVVKQNSFYIKVTVSLLSSLIFIREVSQMINFHQNLLAFVLVIEGMNFSGFISLLS
jgi:hypothetical protein